MSRRHRIFRFVAEIPSDLRERAAKAFSYQRVTAMNRRVSDFLVKRFAQYIYDRSLTRHKSADRLGAPHTGVLEFSRGMNPSYTRRGGKIFGRVTGGSAEIAIQGVPGLARAERALDIFPRKANALTIPVAKESYAKTAKKMSDAGWRLFVPNRKRYKAVGNGILMGSLGGVTKPLFLLRKSVHVRRDPHLLPSSRMVADWTSSCVAEYMEAAGQ